MSLDPWDADLRERSDATLFERYQRERDAAARAALVERFLPLARHLARRYHSRADADDLNQVASVGLLKAIDRFDPSRGLAFSTFAVPTILGELRRYFRDFGWSVRVPRDVQELALRLDRMSEDLGGELGRAPTPAELAERCDATVEQVVEALATATAHHAISLDQPRTEDGDQTTLATLQGSDDPEYSRVEDAALLERLLGSLPEREQLVLTLRFKDELTQAQIGERIGVSQMHVSRLIRQSITTLQRSALS